MLKAKRSDLMERSLSQKEIIRLAVVFALIYFFSPNGMASLPAITVDFLLKDVLKMTATAAAYFSAATILGWAIKPLWGIISDTLPIFGYRRKSYLILTAVLAAFIWFYLGQIDNYTVKTLLTLFIISSLAYAFMDVVCDALMVENGKPYNLTGRFQSVQWTSVYTASVITGLAGGWAAENLAPGTVFSINAVFPLIILIAALLFVKEDRALQVEEQVRKTRLALKDAFRHPTLWLLAFFLFFWTFSPSFGAPFFYYAVDNLRFDKMFFGIAAAAGSASAALGAVAYGKFYRRLKTRSWVKLAIITGVIATLLDLIYFTQFVSGRPELARAIYLTTSGILGIVSSATFLVMMNAAALAAPKYGEGTTFAFLTSFWNIGLMGSNALGGFLFSKIGLVPLIWVSAAFTAGTWLFLRYLKFADEEENGL
jgi:MFS family permease